MEILAICLGFVAVVMSVGLSGAMARKSDEKIASLGKAISKDLDGLADVVRASKSASSPLRLPDTPQSGPLRTEASLDAIDAYKGHINVYGFVYESVLQGGYRLVVTHARDYESAKEVVEAGVKAKLGPLTEWRPSLETILKIAIPKAVSDSAPKPVRLHEDYVNMIRYARDNFAVDPAEKVILNSVISRVESKYQHDSIRR